MKDNKNIVEKSNNEIWWCILVYALIESSMALINRVVIKQYPILFSIIAGILGFLLIWVPILLIPVVIRYGFKKIISKKSAIIYTIITSIIFIGVFNVLVGSYTGVSASGGWNIIQLIMPYYILTNSPVFSFNKKNDIVNDSKDTILKNKRTNDAFDAMRNLHK